MPSKRRSIASQPHKITSAVAVQAEKLRADAILTQRLQALLTTMEEGTLAPAPAPSMSQPPAADTAFILAAIESSRASLLVRIDLAEECNLIRNDLDKIGGHLSESKTRVSVSSIACSIQAASKSNMRAPPNSLTHPWKQIPSSTC